VAHGIAKEPVKDQLRITLARDGSTLTIVGDVTAPNLIWKESLCGKFKGPVRGFATNPVCDELVDGRSLGMLMVTRKKTPGGVAVGRKAKVTHIVQYQEVLLVMCKRAHQWGHPKVAFRTAFNIP
jgi:hypothetical protein